MLLAASCSTGGVPPRDTPAPTGDGALGRFETVADGLEVPWGLAFADASTILVTERRGRVLLVDDGAVRAEPVATVDAVAEGEGGLLGIALHPDFPEQRFAYLSYSAADGNRVSRFPVDARFRFGAEEVLVRRIPSARFHDGGGIAFGPDGMLYVTTGDAQEPALAADPSSLAGKILRFTPDGAVPEDNPTPDSPVWSYGHRNPQGLAWDGGGRLYASEHGPTGEFGLCCHDEINLIEKGSFYGWPFFAGRTRGMGGDPPAQHVPPLRDSGEQTWAPAGVAVVGEDLYVAMLAGERLARFGLDGEREAIAAQGSGRLRAAAVGPDGCLYVTTSNRDGRGDPDSGDDRILRACPGD